MRGILITIEANTAVFEGLQREFGVSYLKGQNTNQDFLESYFGQQRYKNGSCTHPTALQFLNTVSRDTGSRLASDPTFDLLGKRIEIEKSLKVEPMPDTDFKDIEKMLKGRKPSKMLESEKDGFYRIACSVAEKFHITHPNLVKAKVSSSSSNHLQFANPLSKGFYSATFV